MYKINHVPPWYLVYSEVNEFVARCNCFENAEIIKRLLNYDLVFKKPYSPINKLSKNSKISFEELVNNNKL